MLKIAVLVSGGGTNLQAIIDAVADGGIKDTEITAVISNNRNAFALERAKKLGEALGGVVEDCVNKVGVDLNTASASLLEYISGVSKVIAKNIVAYREENGRFESRKELLKVAKLGPKAFESGA